MAVKRSTTTRDRHRAQIRRTKPPCGICDGPIDYTLHWRNPGAFVVDHIIPLALGGPDTIENKQAAHRHCNQQKADKAPEEMAAASAPREFVTWRTW
ncbi:HNH endonuclease signature motif containing protein [Nocardia sp. No.11]|uniref:HNH endonuclease n=1 Tax=Nocardia sp. No.11 TaxID=3128861 RepID=UPI00319D90D7